MPDAFVPRYLTPAQVEGIARDYLAQVEASLVKEHLQAVAKTVVGGDLVETQHAEPLMAALEAERDRMLSGKDGG